VTGSHLLIMALIVLGNVAFLTARRRRTGSKEK
jgi:hypothetical protein